MRSKLLFLVLFLMLAVPAVAEEATVLKAMTGQVPGKKQTIDIPVDSKIEIVEWYPQRLEKAFDDREKMPVLVKYKDQAGVEHELYVYGLRKSAETTLKLEEPEKSVARIPEKIQEELKKSTEKKSSCDKCVEDVEKQLGLKLTSLPKDDSSDCSPYSKHRCKSSNKKSCDIEAMKSEKLAGKPFNEAIALIDQWIVEAVNEINKDLDQEGKRFVDPALIKALISAESKGNPLAGASDGGKGLGQFTFEDVAKENGLDYNAPKPEVTTQKQIDEYWGAAYNKKNANGLYPVWSPKGSIIAMAKKIASDLNQKMTIYKNRKDKKSPKEVSVLLKRNAAENARYAVASYNAGMGTIRKYLEEPYAANQALPSSFAQAWEMGVPEGLKSSTLELRCVNRCHVEKIAGMCGDAPGGLFASYKKHFKLENEKWVRAT